MKKIYQIPAITVTHIDVQKSILTTSTLGMGDPVNTATGAEVKFREDNDFDEDNYNGDNSGWDNGLW